MFGEKREKEEQDLYIQYKCSSPKLLLVCWFFYVIFSMLCSRYVYMQTHVLLMSKNKDNEW